MKNVSVIIIQQNQIPTGNTGTIAHKIPAQVRNQWHINAIVNGIKDRCII